MPTLMVRGSLNMAILRAMLGDALLGDVLFGDDA
jgi:hypothetical protein